ncbi:glutamate--tRNA ligase [Patescibacteria group bacterium]|nr:glutamate--tRNA ligase [Patescibacteria group bacterium]
MTKIKTRFAPSPTGYLHIGGLRTALYSYAFAKSKGGDFLLRIEDTDRSRFVPGATEKIYETLKMFGLNWDQGPLVGGPSGPYVQSERTKEGIYRKYAQKLVDENHAYYCFCPQQSKEEIRQEHEGKKISMRDEECRNLSREEVEERIKKGEKPAIRLRVPAKEKISFKDFVLGKEISWDSENIDEVMLLKSDGFPTYHLAVVVDDHLMGITHIIRGRDWLPSTPVHLFLFKYLDFELPEIGHLTDILDPGGGKLSKRKGTVSVEEFLKEGYLPEALLNFIMLLGWAPKDNREIFSLKEFVENFEKGDLQISNPVFNRTKLDWFNGYYIRQLKVDELNSKFETLNPKFKKQSPEKQIKITKLIQDRIVNLSDLDSLAGFFFEKPKVDACLFKDLPYNEHLAGVVKALGDIENWSNEEIQKSLSKLIEKNNWKTGDFYMSFRIALTGSRFTPPVTESAEILGKEETLKRLRSLL